MFQLKFITKFSFGYLETPYQVPPTTLDSYVKKRLFQQCKHLYQLDSF